MKRPLHLSTGNEQGYTLVEVMVSAVVAGIMLTTLVTSGAVFQRIFAASDGGLKATADQSRAMDYIARDVRQALTAVVSNGGQKLTLTVPDFVDPNTGLSRIPTVNSLYADWTLTKGTVDYGAGLTVSYFTANAPTPPSTTYTLAANGRYLIRQVGTTQTVLSLDCTSLQLSFTDQGTSILTSISYQPRYNVSGAQSTRDATAIYSQITLRNTRRN